MRRGWARGLGGGVRVGTAIGPRRFPARSLVRAGHRNGGMKKGIHESLLIRPGRRRNAGAWGRKLHDGRPAGRGKPRRTGQVRSEEHTSELQSRENLVCRLLLEKKKT